MLVNTTWRQLKQAVELDPHSYRPHMFLGECTPTWNDMRTRWLSFNELSP